MTKPVLLRFRAILPHVAELHVLYYWTNVIEIDNNFCKSEQCKVRMDVRAKMGAEGYKRYEKLVHASDIYVHPESPFQIPESIAIPK